MDHLPSCFDGLVTAINDANNSVTHVRRALPGAYEISVSDIFNRLRPMAKVSPKHLEAVATAIHSILKGSLADIEAIEVLIASTAVEDPLKCA